jgi:hypothetical protein
VGIVTLPGQLREQVRREVREALMTYLSPLAGGPAVPGAASLDSVCPAPDGEATQGCADLRGTGWPLGMEVRRQDLEAVATRVSGVRYVQSIKLGVLTAAGSTLTDVERVQMAGLQLPHLVGLSVREGEAEDLAALLGQQPAVDVPPTMVPVPVLPQTC